jgi:hypothetical protein
VYILACCGHFSKRQGLLHDFMLYMHNGTVDTSRMMNSLPINIVPYFADNGLRSFFHCLSHASWRHHFLHIINPSENFEPSCRLSAERTVIVNSNYGLRKVQDDEVGDCWALLCLKSRHLEIRANNNKLGLHRCDPISSISCLSVDSSKGFSYRLFYPRNIHNNRYGLPR